MTVGQDAEQNARRSSYIVVAGAVLVWVLWTFRKTVEDQLSRLRVPGHTAYNYNALHGPHLPDAFASWRAAQLDLQTFQPVDFWGLIRLRSAIAAAFTIAATVVLVLLLRRHKKGGWRYGLVAEF